MSMVKDSDFWRAVCGSLCNTSGLSKHLSGQGNLYNPTRTGAAALVRVKLSWHWKPVGIPQNPGNL